MPSFGIGYDDTIPPWAPPTAYLPDGQPIYTPFRDPLQDAFDQLGRIHSRAADLLPPRAEPQGPDTNFAPFSSGPLSQDDSWPLFPSSPQLFPPAEPMRYAGTGEPPATIGPLDSVSWPVTDAGQPAASEGSSDTDGQTEQSVQPGEEASPPAALPSEQSAQSPAGIAGPSDPAAGSDTVDDKGSMSQDNVQIAQTKPAPQRRNPPAGSASPKPETGELPLQVRANQLTDRRRSHATSWEELIRQPLPEIRPIDQQPLPDDWQRTLNAQNPNYVKWTNAAAEKYGIPPLLLARLMYKESNYVRTLVSPRGAKGIAQLMPKAVTEAGLNPATFDYFNAEKSINAGAALLAKYYGEFKDWPKAVAAYNMGNTSVRDWFAGDPATWKNPANAETKRMLQYVFRGEPHAFSR